jgi:hypothetical protein
VSPALIFWALVFAARLIRGRSGGGAPPRGLGETFDGLSVLAAFAQGIGVLLALNVLGTSTAAVLASSWLVLVFPRWAAWRVCQPLGLRRTGLFLLVWVAAGPVARAGRRRLLEWSLGAGLPVPGTPAVPADGWTACAAALRAEALGDAAGADALVRGLADLPREARLPGTVMRVGAELLAEAALRRGDMEAVLLRASLGRGRGCRFLRLLARAHLAADVGARWLWVAWALAPRRRLHKALVARAPLRPAPAAAAETRGGLSAWRLHLRLMDRAARGERIDRALVLRLAAVWDAPLGAAGLARLRARALELGVIDPESACRAVNAAVLADLEALAAVAEGAWPLEAVHGDGLPGILVAGAENRLYADLDPWVEPYRNGEKTEVRDPLEEWRRWLAFKGALDRLQDALGEEAVATSWHAGVRLAAWNWPCRLLDLYQEKAAWACRVMFEWTVALAERVGDEEAVTVNRENAAVAARLMPR